MAGAFDAGAGEPEPEALCSVFLRSAEGESFQRCGTGLGRSVGGFFDLEDEALGAAVDGLQGCAPLDNSELLLAEFVQILHFLRVLLTGCGK